MLKRKAFHRRQFFLNRLTFPRCLPRLLRCTVLTTALTFFLPQAGQGIGSKPSMEEAQFDIYVAGKEIGAEKYSILFSEDSASSSSVLDFRDPGNKHQKVHLETQLNMDGRFVPRSYRLRSDVDGRRVVMEGAFSQGQAIFEYSGNGNPRKRGLLVGDRYSILDTNVFHHFIFIAQLFNFDGKEESQSFEVVVPQEMDNGILRISEVGKEKIQVRGKKRSLRHLRADSGLLQIDLWVDDQRVLYKIALPAKKIEVIRD